MSPEELDETRVEEARRRWNSNDPTIPDIATGAARLAREGWTPPEPVVDPDVLAFRVWATTLWPNVPEGILHGNMDYTEAAKGYLAGARMAREQERERAAASAERIKELEARVAELEADDAIEWRKAAALMRQFFRAGREADQ